jgi:predicted NUDIX family NTP pyrophosphohydrolase
MQRKSLQERGLLSVRLEDGPGGCRMGRQSAGLLMYRRGDCTEVLLVHPGGPFFRRKDAGVWSVPKGEYDDDEDPISVAVREFEEETGVAPPIVIADLVELGSVIQRSGKTVFVWAAEGDVDVSDVRSNTFAIEWPPKSGRMENFPEVDRAGWFDFATAKEKLVPAQGEFIDRLGSALGEPASAPAAEPGQAELF